MNTSGGGSPWHDLLETSVCTAEIMYFPKDNGTDNEGREVNNAFPH